MITKETFNATIPNVNWNYISSYIPFFDTILPQYEIDTPLRKAHFLAQVTHESGGFKFLIENLNYSATALYAVFRKYFPTIESATNYSRQAEKIANKVYANRMGNGSEVSGDGWKFRGRGLIQLTGKANYQALSTTTGVDFISNPDQLIEAKWALTSACWYWKQRNLNKYADLDDIHMVTKLINGGFNGIENRQLLLDEYKKEFNI